MNVSGFGKGLHPDTIKPISEDYDWRIVQRIAEMDTFFFLKVNETSEAYGFTIHPNDVSKAWYLSWFKMQAIEEGVQMEGPINRDCCF